MIFVRKMFLTGLMLVLGLSISACSFNVERNEDGSWTITGHVSEAEISDLLNDVINNPQVQNVNVQFHSGYMTASVEFTNVAGTHVDTMTFRMDAGVKDGHLDLVMSDVRWNGDPAQDARVAEWNANLAAALEKGGQRHPNSQLEAVTITDSDMTLVWHAEGRRDQQ